jgi:hypothetical protein
MYRIEMLDGTIEFWNERIIKKIIPSKTNHTWEIFDFNNNGKIIKAWRLA